MHQFINKIIILDMNYSNNKKFLIITALITLITLFFIIFFVFKKIKNADNNNNSTVMNLTSISTLEETSFLMEPETNGANVVCNSSMSMKSLYSRNGKSPYNYIACKVNNTFNGVKDCINGSKSYYIPNEGNDINHKVCYKPCPPGYKSSFAQNLQNPSTYPKCIDENTCPVIKCPIGYQNENSGTDKVKCVCADDYSLVTNRTDKFNNTCVINCKPNQHYEIDNDNLICVNDNVINCKNYGLTAGENNSGCVMKADLNTENATCTNDKAKKINIKDKEFVICERISSSNNPFYNVKGCINNSYPYTLGEDYKINVANGDGQLKTCFKQCPDGFKSKYPEDFKNYKGTPTCVLDDKIEMKLDTNPDHAICKPGFIGNVYKLDNKDQLQCTKINDKYTSWGVEGCTGGSIPYNANNTLDYKTCFIPCPPNYNVQWTPYSYPSCILNKDDKIYK